MKKFALVTSVGLSGMLLAGALFSGCEKNANTAGDELDGNFTGLYTNPLGGALVTTNSGNPVTQFNLTQAQDQLHAVDNNGTVFSGTLAVAYANGGMIKLDGVTGAGTPVHIEGYLEAAGANAWITASWIEPDFVSPLYGTTQVTPFSPTNPALWKP